LTLNIYTHTIITIYFLAFEKSSWPLKKIYELFTCKENMTIIKEISKLIYLGLKLKKQI